MCIRDRVEKLRKALKIELLVAEETPAAPRLPKPSSGRTLGDLIKMRKSAKSEEGAE